MGRRVLITGLATFWGGRVARALERHSDVDVIVGLDNNEPTIPLERTEFVRADKSYSILSRLVRATKVDTVIHAALVVDSTRMADRGIHENNVIGTMNLLAAATGTGSEVRTLLVKSSTLVYGAARADPTWFAETTRRTGPARTRIERTLLEVESFIKDYAKESDGAQVSILRFANVLGGEISNPLSTALGLPLVPKIVGFDPQLQFVEEHDVVRAIVFAVETDLAGIYNVAGDGRLPWSEVLAIAGKRAFPLPPFLTSQTLEPLARAGVLDLPPEALALLRFGRGVDNRRFKACGFSYRYDTAGAVQQLAETNRLRAAVGAKPEYRYESDVETFFRHSPAVVHDS